MLSKSKSESDTERFQAFSVVVVRILGTGRGFATSLQAYEHDDIALPFPQLRAKPTAAPETTSDWGKAPKAPKNNR